MEVFQKCEWKRAEDIPALLDENGQLSIFHEDVTPHDIIQG
jgi:hypothetical protein